MRPMRALCLLAVYLSALAILSAGNAKPPGAAGAASRPASRAASRSASQPATSAAKVYQAWPFDANEAARRQEATAKALGVKRELVFEFDGNVAMKLVLVPAGRFMMGSPKDEKERFDDEGPRHEVTITRPFYMGVCDVTQGQFALMMGWNASQFRDPNNPVEFVTWKDAAAFCKAVSESTGLSVRLPTEAEWEYACRAGSATPFNTGDTISVEQANYDGDYVYGEGVTGKCLRQTTPAGSYKPNAFGLCDMHGNVWQWCSDWYDDDYYANSPKTDPAGPKKGEFRVMRGGSWFVNPWSCRSAFRGTYRPVHGNFAIGFRVVCEVAGR